MSLVEQPASKNRETALAYIAAGFRKDYVEAGSYIASNYVWIDHTLPTALHETAEALQVAVADAEAWTDEAFELHRVTDALDGSVILQFTITGTHSGTWRGIPATGTRASVEACDILRFDDDGKICIEEAYFDALTQIRQLGVTHLSE
jgi:steroid delta-isomerase-like uncharacterized protein